MWRQFLCSITFYLMFCYAPHKVLYPCLAFQGAVPQHYLTSPPHRRVRSAPLHMWRMRYLRKGHCCGYRMPFTKICFFFFLGAQLDYLSQPPLRLVVAMWLSSSQWKANWSLPFPASLEGLSQPPLKLIVAMWLSSSQWREIEVMLVASSTDP